MEEIGLALSSSVTVVLTWWVIMLIARKTVLYVPLILSFVAVGLIHPFLDRKTYPSPVTLNTQIVSTTTSRFTTLYSILFIIIRVKYHIELWIPVSIGGESCPILERSTRICPRKVFSWNLSPYRCIWNGVWFDCDNRLALWYEMYYAFDNYSCTPVDTEWKWSSTEREAKAWASCRWWNTTQETTFSQVTYAFDNIAYLYFDNVSYIIWQSNKYVH